MGYGIQLYGLRDLAKENFEEAVRAAARIGFESIEFAGFFGRSAKEVTDILSSSGIAVCGSHSSWIDLRDNFDETVRFHKEIGNSHYTIPGADLGTPEKLKDFADFLNYIEPKMKSDGLSLAYHNHSHEFLVNSFGVRIHDVLAAETKVHFEIDTYWAFNAGEDPCAILEKYAHRMSQAHLKDGTRDGKGRALGEGAMPLNDVISTAKKLGIYLIVESETQTPDGVAENSRCINWLKASNLL